MRYEVDRCCTYRITDEGEREMMCNFCAEIVEEVRYVDGVNQETYLTIAGKRMEYENGEDKEVEFPEVRINADSFPGMQWVMQRWGARAILQPGSGVKDDLRAAIQLRSKPKVTTIYRHTGWIETNGQRKFLHSGGAIGKNGNDPSVRVELPKELERYDLTTDADEKEAFAASIALARELKPEIGWPLLGATLTPIFGPVDFGVHLTGRTGTFKSEVMSLFQSHYGAAMDSRHLPGSWSSTANALEAQAFMAKNCGFVIDDFVPQGTSWQVRAYQAIADKIIRAQGNQAGRARLSDVSNLQQTMYPRGIVLSTGEDTPEGHSVRARLMILELSPGDIDPKKLTAAQQKRKLFPATTVSLLKQLAAEPYDLTERTEELRTKYAKYGHTRTPAMLGRVVATLEYVLTHAERIGAITHKQGASYIREAVAATESIGSKQQGYLEETDPVDIFTSAIRQVVGSGGGHFRTLNGGIPRNATALGWTTENIDAEFPTYKSRGPTIGWVKWNDNEMYLDITGGFNIVKKAAGSELTLTKQTLFRRLKDAGMLLRCDESRQRNTVRVNAEQHPRTVLCLNLAQVLQTLEGHEDGEGEGDDEDDE